MVSRSKLYAQLDVLEDELKEKIVPRLESAAYGKNDLIFCVSEFNRFSELKYNTDKNTEELIYLGRKILSLKEKLGESSEGSIAERICWYCREWAAINKPDQHHAQGLAKQFLDEIKDSS